MTDANKITATARTEFGKGAARRTRRSGNVPAVLYGHGTDPRHVALNTLEFAAILREHGTNALLELAIENDTELALVKQVVVHPVRRHIEHADLLLVKRGEKVEVEIPVVLVGDAASGTLVTTDAATLRVLADAVSIPERLEHSIEGAQPGSNIHAADIELPTGVELVDEPDLLIAAVGEAPSAAQMAAAEGAEGDTEAAGTEAAAE